MHADNEKGMNMELFIWWALGALGGFVVWKTFKREFPEDFGRCPTRKGAIGITLYGVTGAIGLVAALIVYFAIWMIDGPKRKKPPSRISEWLNKPIC